MIKFYAFRNYLKDFFLLFKSFGFKIAFFRVIVRLFNCCKKAKHKAIMEYLKKHYCFIINEYKQKEQISEFLLPDCPIWICWFQGEKQMPPIVKGCYNSVKKNAGSHPIILITFENYKEYVSIPEYIIRKLENKDISLAQFSDIIRNNLLADHGGIWLDATIFLTDKLKGWNKTFYSIKQNRHDNNEFVSAYRWTGFCMGGIKNNILNSFVKDFFNAYHLKERFLIDYLLIDYIIALGYEEIPLIREMIDSVPFSNPNLYYMQQKMALPIDEKELLEVCHETYIFKLSWKKVIPSDKNTLYSHLGFDKIM